ncbi:MAG: pitrilysin family protein [Candidatus Edwardsbacteria bacterium]
MVPRALLRAWTALLLISLSIWQDCSASPFTPPKVYRERLKNGLLVLIVERPQLPIVNLSLMIKSGATAEREEKAGLANLVSALLTKGTKNKTAGEIAEMVDFLGAKLSTRCEHDASYLSLSMLKKDFAAGLDIFCDLLLNPTFKQEELERRKSEIIAELIRRKDDPHLVGQETFNETIFGRHPYHCPVEGYTNTVKEIMRTDLEDFYQNFYRPNNSVLAIVGDVKRKEVLTQIKKLLKVWEAKFVFSLSYSPPSTFQKSQLKFVQKKLSQAYIYLGFVGLSRKNPDFYAVRLMNYILGGGGFASRMTNNIRVKQGLAYDVDSYFEARLQPGPFVASLQTKNESADTALKSLLYEMRRLQETPVSEEELSEAKSFYTGFLPFRIETNEYLSELLLAIELHNLGQNYFQDYFRKIEEVTVEDIQRVAREYLCPDRFTLVIVGDTTKINLNLLELER